MSYLVKVDVEELISLKENAFLVQCLYDNGVDSWEGYDYSYEEFLEHFEK